MNLLELISVGDFLEIPVAMHLCIVLTMLCCIDAILSYTRVGVWPARSLNYK